MIILMIILITIIFMLSLVVSLFFILFLLLFVYHYQEGAIIVRSSRRAIVRSFEESDRSFVHRSFNLLSIVRSGG